MKVLIQYTHTVYGTVGGTITTDVIKLNDDTILLYHGRNDISHFKLEIESRNEYNKKNFDEFIKNPQTLAKSQFLSGMSNRGYIEPQPDFKPMCYYEHIFRLDQDYNRKLGIITRESKLIHDKMVKDINELVNRMKSTS